MALKNKIMTNRAELLFEVIVGSKAYGLDLPTSDEDRRGIFLAPNDMILTNSAQDQLNDKNNDIIHYELNRYMQLLKQSNPNILELLFSDMITHYDKRIQPLLDNRDKFLTKQMRHTFGGYAISQIKKARGRKKKIVNPVSKKKKTPLDFCHIFEKESGYMMTAHQWLKKNNFRQENIGLSKMPNGNGLFKVYYDWIGEEEATNPRFEHMNKQPRYRGIVKAGSDELRHSEIPKGALPHAFLVYDKDGYSTYCKQYSEYWEWVNKRNPHRYNDNAKNGKGYDGKNMMHCVRMLEMSIDVAKTGELLIKRPNRDFLLSIRKGEYEYDYLIDYIDEMTHKLDEAFLASELPENIDLGLINQIILEIR